jgi:hypothetical protein
MIERLKDILRLVGGIGFIVFGIAFAVIRNVEFAENDVRPPTDTTSAWQPSRLRSVSTCCYLLAIRNCAVRGESGMSKVSGELLFRPFLGPAIWTDR